ncbi:MAG: mechanosensitive ion channel family protein [Steroidobacteraceae bacterium]
MWHKLIHELLGVSEAQLYGNSLVDWVEAAILVALIWSALLLLRKVIASRYRRFTGEGHLTAIRLFAYLIGHTRHLVFIAVALYAAEEFLTFPPRIHTISTNIIVILLLVQVGIWAGRMLQFYLEIRNRRNGGADLALTSSLDIIKFVSMVLIWSLVTLVALDNLGVNITALLAGLGVGGVAVALALQNVLGDLFASLAIALDKPFVVGDTLVLDTYTGKVERIGIKTTRLRADSGEQIILSNADILKSRVRNFSGGEERRALLTLNIDPDTKVEVLREIPRIVEAAVRRQPNSRFDRCHLKNFGDWSLQFETAFFTKDPAASPILDLQQAVNLEVLEEFRRRGIRLAVPAQRVLNPEPPAKDQAVTG